MARGAVSTLARAAALFALAWADAAPAEDELPGVALQLVSATGQPASRLSIGRTPPPAGELDPDAFSVVVSAGRADLLPAKVNVTSLRAPESSPTRVALESFPELPLSAAPCPAGMEGLACAKSAPLRLVFDDVDRHHPQLERRSMLAELGGAVVVSAGGVERTLRVESDFGRHRARVRVRLVRIVPRGAPPIGKDDADAVRIAREELERASGVWSVCGISFGPADKADVAVVDPPPPFLLSLGCDAPAIAAGGSIRFVADGRELEVPIPTGTTPRGAARRVQAALEKLGLRVRTSDNRAPQSSSIGSTDVLVTRRDGLLAALGPPAKGPLSTDPALDACIGRVSLEDGLQHFTDSDAVAGTLEERTLVKSMDDGDPETIDVLVLPSFGGDSRIGESFIFLEHGAIRNVVLEDRAGFRAQRASFTLAHELGHVLLDQPGHPDDFGADTPTSLMDADAVSPTAFGPRRLSAAECERAYAQSGPDSLSAVLRPWPLSPLAPVKKGKAKGA